MNNIGPQKRHAPLDERRLEEIVLTAWSWEHGTDAIARNISKMACWPDITEAEVYNALARVKDRSSSCEQAA